MRKSKLQNLFVITLVSILLLSIPHKSDAAKKIKIESDKDRLVLMPLRLTEDIQFMQGAMETSLVEGLQEKYLVFAGEDVAKKTREIFKKATEKQKCDETRCLQDIAIAFQSELVAVANINKIEGGYLLALSIRDVMTNEAVYSKTIPCEGCNPFRVVDRLKELGGATLVVAHTVSVIPEVSAKALSQSESVLKQIDNLPNGNYVTQGGLTWSPISFNRTWTDANAYCSRAIIKAQSNWRLPTTEELSDLYKSGELNDKGWTLSSSWSSKLNGRNSHEYVNLSNGDVFSDEDTFHNFVTCVHETTSITNITQVQLPELRKDNFVTLGSLIWMPIETQQTWFLANTYCTNTTINGKSGWRLPTRDEFGTLFESGIVKNQVWSNYSLWSSTQNGSGYHYVFDLINGRSAHSEGDDIANFVLCVHKTSELPSGYVNNAGLNWMPINNLTMHWEDANNYCASNNSKYLSGWRLPFVEELNSLYASGEMKNHAWTLGYTWSNTKSGNNEHYLTDLKSGKALSNQDGYNNLVTCVHSN
jgi:hypothetical protein